MQHMSILTLPSFVIKPIQSHSHFVMQIILLQRCGYMDELGRPT